MNDQKFAHIHEITGIGQTVVMLQHGEDGNPEVRFFVRSARGHESCLGICSVAISFNSASEGAEQSATEAFDKAVQSPKMVKDFIKRSGILEMIDQLDLSI